MSVVRDVTGDHREGEQLDRSERLQELVTATSHDLRGPLAVARGNAELAVETDDPSRFEAGGRSVG